MGYPNYHICEESGIVNKWGKQDIVIQEIFQTFNVFDGNLNKHSYVNGSIKQNLAGQMV